MALIHTINHGDIDEAELKRVDGQLDNDNEFTKWIEYWQGDVLVRRDVHVTLKPAAACGLSGVF